jgi:uncharacterized membrane protein YfcA
VSATAILSGFGVGAIVGMTGVGGGSLMTPLLLSAFRLSPAIGTDLWFAALTKTAGSLSHHQAGHVQWRIVALLLGGSLPASVTTIALMHATGFAQRWSAALTFSLGIALLVTAVTVAYRHLWQGVGIRLERWIPARRKAAATVLCGLLLGVLVSLSSIGAGAIGATLILLVHPRLESTPVVGTDIAHVVPLTLVAGIGFGAQLTRCVPERVVRSLLCLSLLTAGLKVID